MKILHLRHYFFFALLVCGPVVLSLGNIGIINFSISFVFLLLLIRPIILLRYIEIEEEGLKMNSKIIRWQQITSIKPFYFRGYIDIVYLDNFDQKKIMIAGPTRFRDLFREDLKSKYIDSLTDKWQAGKSRKD